MLRKIVRKTFDVRDGEFRMAVLMLAYIFLVISVLLIVKPTVNALFLSQLGVEQLPFAFMAVAATAILSSFFYSKALIRFRLNRIIKTTLFGSTLIFIIFGLLLKFDWVPGWLIYLIYIWVAIYAVLSASQFWVLANLVYTVREAKRLFGFIGSGAIFGGIFGGYLTSLLAPVIGNDNLILVAALLLVCCVPVLGRIWKAGDGKYKKQTRPERFTKAGDRPFQLILKSKHLTYIAGILAVSVLTAKLVDYLFSDFAAAAITDTEELTAFFAFWFSTFNLLALAVQLFFTHRIVGIWGVGFSLLLLPIGILMGSLFFLVLPGLSAVVVIKSMDGVLKQSVNKSATELLSLPLDFDLKNRTKSFIDVVVDSIATGIAGCLLIFLVRALDLPSYYISFLIVFLVVVWCLLIFQVRKAYYATFRTNLELETSRNEVPRSPVKKVSVIKGMRQVFRQGSEEQLLFMLDKLMEINDKRFEKDVERLLEHPSLKVRTAAIKNLYFLNPTAMVSNLDGLLYTGYEPLTLVTLEYILLHAEKDNRMVFDKYLDDTDAAVSNAALYCLARESRNNPKLQQAYGLVGRIQNHVDALSLEPSIANRSQMISILKTIGTAGHPEFYPLISESLKHTEPEVVEAAIFAAGLSKNDLFIAELIALLPKKQYRDRASNALQNYGPNMIAILTNIACERLVPLDACRFIPTVLLRFPSQETVRGLFRLMKDEDLSVRLESIRALDNLRKQHSQLQFDKKRVVALLFEECKLHHRILSAMHTQIIISYRNRTKSKKEIKAGEREARTSLLELLERRLEAGLERIFKLLGLRYSHKDIEIAYEGFTSDRLEARTNAVEFLDNLLTGDLKRALLPVLESAIIDTTSEENLRGIQQQVLSEMDCFELLLDGKDLKLKLAVLYLIEQQGDEKYVPLVMRFIKSDEPKLRTFADRAWKAILAGQEGTIEN